MDYEAFLKELYLEREQLNEVIAALETLAAENRVRALRPGRNGMSDEERAAVSERMKRYGASQKNQLWKIYPKGRGSLLCMLSPTPVVAIWWSGSIRNGADRRTPAFISDSPEQNRFRSIF
jgi:hypothetical protein